MGVLIKIWHSAAIYLAIYKSSIQIVFVKLKKLFEFRVNFVGSEFSVTFYFLSMLLFISSMSNVLKSSRPSDSRSSISTKFSGLRQKKFTYFGIISFWFCILALIDTSEPLPEL